MNIRSALIQSPRLGVRQTVLFALTAVTLILSACETNPTAPAGQSVQYERGLLLQKVDAAIAASETGAGLRLVTAPDPVVTGGTLQLGVSVSRPGYLYLYQIATDGRTLSLVFPNAIDGANYIAAGLTQLPRQSWQLKAHGPAGTGYLLAVQTPQPLDALVIQSEASKGNIKLTAPYSAALATLREVAP